MADDLLDLDAVARPDLRVKLGGKTWRIPGGPDSELVAQLSVLFREYEKAAEEEKPERVSELASEIREQIELLFAARHTEAELEDLPKLDDEQMAELFVGLVNSWAGEAKGADPPPTQTQPKPKSGARSRRRSASQPKRSAS